MSNFEHLSIPPENYTSDDVTSNEIATLFREGWIGVGRADVVQAPGDFISLDIAEQNIILLRDDLGHLRAFANSCRHRGTRLVDGNGSCKGMRCPFHSWFYGLDGRLISAPRMEKLAGFDKANFGLVAYRAEERLGFAFICMNPDAISLDEQLGDFALLHQTWPLQSLRSVRRRELDVECNWKAFIEVFNEYYHLPFVHASTIDAVYTEPEAADKVRGAYASQFGRTQGTGGLLEEDQEKSLPPIPGLSENAKMGARYTWVFPNMTFAANRDALWCYEAYPLGASSCKVVQTSCFPEETIALPDFAEKSAAYLKRMDAALAEDIEVLLQQHKGLSSPEALPGPFQPDLEPNVETFSQWYRQQMM